MIWLLAIFSVLPCVIQETPKQHERIKQWIGQLGSEDYETRESATRKLKAAGEDAVPLLKEAVGSKDKETALRARAIVKFLTEDPAIVKAEKQATENAKKRLSKVRGLGLHEKVRVDDLLRKAASTTGCNVFFDRGLPNIRKRITIDARRLTAAEFIEAIVGKAEMKMTIHHGIIVVAARDNSVEPGQFAGPDVSELRAIALKGKSAQTLDRLTSKRVHLRFEPWAFQDAMGLLGRLSGVEVHVPEALHGTQPRPDAGGHVVVRDGAPNMVFTRLRQVRAYVALQLLCRQVGADWNIQDDGTIRISKKR